MRFVKALHAQTGCCDRHLQPGLLPVTEAAGGTTKITILNAIYSARQPHGAPSNAEERPPNWVIAPQYVRVTALQESRVTGSRRTAVAARQRLT